jgi:subtilase family serine protease
MNIGGSKFYWNIWILLTFLTFFYPYPIRAEAPSSSVYMVFEAPYNELGGALKAEDYRGAAKSTARANPSTGFMGVFGTGWVGGAASEAGFRFQFYVPKDMRLKVTADIRYMGGISGFGYGECEGFQFKWKANKESYHVKQMEGGLTPEWAAEKTWQLAELAAGAINVPAEYGTIHDIYEFMDLLSDIKDVYELITVINEIETSFDDIKTEKITFGFDAKQGWNEIKIVMRGDVIATFTGMGMYSVIGYLKSLRIDGLGYPDLVIEDWSVTSQESWRAPLPEVGKPATLKFKVKNEGNLASENTQLRITGAEQSFTRDVPRFDPNQAQEYEYNFVFPQEQVDITVEVDPDDKIYEFDYNWGKKLQDRYEHMNIPPSAQLVHLKKGGNLLEYKEYGIKPYEPLEANLGFDRLYHSLKIEDGHRAHLVYKVKNLGGTEEYNWCKTAKNIKVKVKIPEIGWQDSKTISSLESGETKEVVFDTPPINRPKDIAESSECVVKVESAIDPDNKIKETNKENNTTVSYIVVIPTIPPQLTVQKLEVFPKVNVYQEGQSVTLKADIEYSEYTGKKPLKNVEVAFYYNKGEWGQSPDLELIADRKIDFDNKGIKSISVIWPAWKSSSIYTDVYCIVDPDNKIAELDESKTIHTSNVGIMVKKKEVTEKPIEDKPLVEGVDLVVDDKDIFLEKQNFVASDYLGVWVHNQGNKIARGQVHLTASWIETDSKGKKKAVTQGLSQIGDTIQPASSRLFKIYFRTLANKKFMFSNDVKLVVDVYPKEDANPSNNRAVFKVGNFDAVASQLGRAEQQAKEEYFTKPDIAVVDIKNTEPPLKVGTKRVFTVVLRNVSHLDAENITMDCVVRPKGSGRPHPELGWKEFKEVVPKIKARSDSSLSIEYTPIRKGVYEIVASIGSVKWQGMQTNDADQSNNHMIKYFGIETSVDAETGGEAAPAGVDLDLAATDIWIDNKTPNVGEVISGGFVVHNYSPVALKNIEWKVYSDANEVAAGTITEIGTGASYTVHASSEADQEGTFTIKAIVDPNNKIPETDENNNAITKQLAITPTSQPISLPNVDVAVVSVSLSNAHIKVGQDTKVQATLKNLGSDTVNAVPVAFLVGDRNFSIKVIDSLAPGETKTVSAPLIGLMGGTYAITVIADRRELIKEVNEQNNRGTATLVVERLIKWQ